MSDTKHEGLPVAGYRPQSNANVALVNGFKQDEERILRKLDAMQRTVNSEYDQRWLAIGRTQLEQAFMAINRSVFQPGRVVLPEDGALKGPVDWAREDIANGSATPLNASGFRTQSDFDAYKAEYLRLRPDWKFSDADKVPDRTAVRDATTGRFTDAEDAKTNPGGTTTETFRG